MLHYYPTALRRVHKLIMPKKGQIPRGICTPKDRHAMHKPRIRLKLRERFFCQNKLLF